MAWQQICSVSDFGLRPSHKLNSKSLSLPSRKKSNVRSQFLVLYSRESVRNRQCTFLCRFYHSSSLGHLFAFVYYFLFRHLVKVSEQIGVLYDSGRTKVAKKKQCIWLFNQSNCSIDLNQPISAKHGNSSSSFYDERNIQCSLELERKEATKQPKEQN